MPVIRYARGLWAKFTGTENPFSATSPSMEDNLRLIDDHLGLYTLQPPQAPGTPKPADPNPGDGQIYTNGTYAVFNDGNWKTYQPRLGVRAVLATGTDSWLCTGDGWGQFSVVDTGPAVSAATGAVQPLVNQAITSAQLAETYAAQTMALTNSRPSVSIALSDTTIPVGGSFTAPLPDGSFQSYIKTSTTIATEFGAPLASKSSIDAAMELGPTSAPLVGDWQDVTLDSNGYVVRGQRLDGSFWEARSGVLVQVSQPSASDRYIQSGTEVVKSLRISDLLEFPAQGLAEVTPLVGDWREIWLDATGSIAYGVKLDGSEWEARSGVLVQINTSSGSGTTPAPSYPADSLSVVEVRRTQQTRPAFSRCFASNYSVLTGQSTTDYVQCIAVPGRFDAVRIGFVHAGGSGAAVGMAAAIAATDDVGNRTNANTPDGRRFATPYRSGIEKNEYSADGWQRVTVGGVNSWDIADGGTLNDINIAWSDLIEVHGIEDAAHPGWYPLLVRIYPGSGAFTRPGLPGFSDPTKFLAETGNAYVLGCYRLSANNSVATLANWSNSNNASFGDSAVLALVVEAYVGSQRARTVMMTGDSRMAYPDPVTEMGTYDYRTLSFKTEKRLQALGKNAVVTRCSQGARTTATYYGRAEKYLEQLRPDVSVYLCYSINDGWPTAALLASARTRVLRHLESCRRTGTVPILLSIFPNNGTIYANAYNIIDAFDTWVESLGTAFLSPLRLYGNSEGNWQAGGGWNSDDAHMTAAGYTDLAERIADVAKQFI